MSYNDRIVYDWKHRGAQGVLLVKKRPMPKAPPPPRWNTGPSPSHPFGTSPPQPRSIPNSPSDEDVHLITLTASPPHVIEYNHGIPDEIDKANPDPKRFLRNPFYKGPPEVPHSKAPSPTITSDLDNSVKDDSTSATSSPSSKLLDIANPTSVEINCLHNNIEGDTTCQASARSLSPVSELSEKLAPAGCKTPIAITEDENCVNTGVRTPALEKDDSSPTENSISSEFHETCQDKRQQSANKVPTPAEKTLSQTAVKVGTKRKSSATKRDPLESVIGKKLNKSRIGISSRLYAKPSRKIKPNPSPDASQDVKALNQSVLLNADHCDKPSHKDSTGDGVLGLEINSAIEEGKTVVDDAPGSVENIVIEVSPYDIKIEEPSSDILDIEEQLRMMEEDEPVDFYRPPPETRVTEEQNELEYPVIRVRNDIWENDEDSPPTQ